jgi:CheY-like chemotaxis protein
MSNSKMLKMLLSRSNIQCDMAFNGLEGVQAVQRHVDTGTDTGNGTDGGIAHYGVIFMDFTMPVKVRWTVYVCVYLCTQRLITAVTPHLLLTSIPERSGGHG